jgi:pyruvate kinase
MLELAAAATSLESRTSFAVSNMAAEEIEHPTRHDRAHAESVLRDLNAIWRELLADPAMKRRCLAEVHANYRDSALNLLHYLTLRRHDLRPLQDRLATLGLSSLGRAEAHVLATVEATLETLHSLTGSIWQRPTNAEEIISFADGRKLLEEHTNAVLGPPAPGREVRIMVTMPAEAGADYTLVHNLLQQGMDCMRINCAHDDTATWARMIDHLRRAESSLGRSCQIVMDLAGPKLRTGPVESAPPVLRVRPHRDAYGRVIAPARLWLTAELAPQSSPTEADGAIPVPAEWLARIRTGERITFVDARNSRRKLRVADVTEGGCWAELNKTAYFVAGTELKHESSAPGSTADAASARVGSLPPVANAIRLYQGDQLLLTRDLRPGRAATRDSSGRVLVPATIGCSIPDVFADLRSGEAIWFDDGKIGGIIETVEPDRVSVRITHARPRGEKLRADKGINLPDSNLQLSALTATDVEHLAFAAQYADVVELSFANTAHDVAVLQQQLKDFGDIQPAIVLKIETRRGFENLPDMLLMAMRSPRCGVMIARGDLAVECGFERLAEVQEEILWICEAAHVPVIWATQVLETLAKDGMPTRAEITDAAMGHRAECVMLNKGPHVLNAVRALDDILRRMRSHQTKKRAMLRELRLARGQFS